MTPLIQLAAILLAAGSATAACTSPAPRRAWHTLTNAQKTEYLQAELCLMAKPASLGLPGCKTRFDELQAVHSLQAYANHHVGAFLPFHRYLMYTHEQALRTECGYTGYQVYWHEQKDAGKFAQSEIFDATYGFGGNGGGSNRCIQNGPFANYTNSLGPGYQVTNHCIDRSINDFMSSGSSQQAVDQCLAATTWAAAWSCIEGRPHGGGHGGVGGQMLNGVSSPGDPLFYLHHTWLDKVWWDWQAKDKAARTTAISGTNIMPPNQPGFPPRPSNIPQPTGAPGDPGTETTLGHILNMYGNQPNKTIGDVLNIQGDFLCYEYIEP